MKLETLQYFSKTGWSVKTLPDLDSENTLIMVFAAPEYIDAQKPIQELVKHYPKSKIIGCSSAGEIAGRSIIDGSLSVAIIKFEKTPIKIVKTEINQATESQKAGGKIASLLSDKNLKGIFVLSNGLQVNGSELVKGLNAGSSSQTVITGGLAGDGKNFQKTWSIFNGEISTSSIVAVGFYGDHINIGHASQGGWDRFGPERRITRSKNNILFELDGKPALTLYREYLGERAKGLPATGLLFPLAIRKDEEDQCQLVRTILAIDEENQSLTFAGDVPSGYLAQLMRANFERLISSAGEAGEQALKRMQHVKVDQTHPMLAVAISCVGRRLLLGERTEEEVESTLSTLPSGTAQIGFYSYGELSPYTTGTCDLHNQTMTLTTFSEN